MLFVWPHEDALDHPQVVVVLSGSTVERLPKGLRVRADTRAPVLVISGGFNKRWPQARAYCLHRRHVPFRVICFHPSPNSTQGEAEELRRLAGRYGWRRILVVTSTYHVFRARIQLRRCLGGRVRVVGARPPLWRDVAGTAEEWPKLVYHLLFDRGC